MRKIKKILSFLITIPLVIILVVLAVKNRHQTVFFFDPLATEQPFFEINAPLYIYIISSFLAGLLAGYLLGLLYKTQKRYKKSTNKSESITDMKFIAK